MDNIDFGMIRERHKHLQIGCSHTLPFSADAFRKQKL